MIDEAKRPPRTYVRKFSTDLGIVSSNNSTSIAPQAVENCITVRACAGSTAHKNRLPNTMNRRGHPGEKLFIMKCEGVNFHAVRKFSIGNFPIRRPLKQLEWRAVLPPRIVPRQVHLGWQKNFYRVWVSSRFLLANRDSLEPQPDSGACSYSK